MSEVGFQSKGKDFLNEEDTDTTFLTGDFIHVIKNLLSNKSDIKEKYQIVHFFNHVLGIQHLVSFHIERAKIMSRQSIYISTWNDSLKHMVHSTNFIIFFPNDQIFLQIPLCFTEYSGTIQTYINCHFKEKNSVIETWFKYAFPIENGQLSKITTFGPKILVCNLSSDEFLIPYQWLPSKWGINENSPPVSLRKVVHIMKFFENPLEYSSKPAELIPDI